MIELTPWVMLLLLVGGAVAGLVIFVACVAIFSHVTDTPVNFWLGPLKVRINDDECE